MKRFILSLMIVGGLALMAAPQARAQSACGNSYGVLMQGGLTSETTDGAVTAAVGVGELAFGAFSSTGGAGGAPGCAISSGELIYNAGDIQASPAGVFFGPQYCFLAISGFGGAPCFDGNSNANDIVGGFLTAGGPGGSYILSFAANYSYFDTTDGFDTYGAIPFGFFVQTNLANALAVGTSIIPGTIPSYAGYGPITTDTPVLTLTMEKQTPTSGSIGTTFGAAPYLGAQAISCSGYGANSTDLIAVSQAAADNTITGGYGSTVGSYVIFNAAQADGELTFNSNSSYVTAPPPADNYFCPFALVPGNYLGAYGNSEPTPAALFADGTANFIALLEVATPAGAAANPACASLLSDGAGYSDSSVQWGTSDQNSYVIVTALLSTATGIVPPGEMATCTSYQQAKAPSKMVITNVAPAVFAGTPTTGEILVTNNNEAACDVTATLNVPSVSVGAYLSVPKVGKVLQYTVTCSTVLLGPSGPVASPFASGVVGPSPSPQAIVGDYCSCSCVPAAASCPAAPYYPPFVDDKASVTLSSAACPIAATEKIPCAN